MEKFDSFIFDVDGTIWDTTLVVANAWNRALTELNLSERVSDVILKGLFGLPMDDIISKILPAESKETREKFKPLCYKYEHEYLLETGGTVYPGVKETFKALSQSRSLFIVSNCQSGYIELMMKKTGITDYVKDFACYGDKGLLKAENIRLIVSRNSLKKPVYVGDTQMDADACDTAQVPIIHAAYGFGTVKAPYAAIHNIGELEKF